MPRVKEMLKLVKRRYAQAKEAPASASKKATPLNEHKHRPAHKGGSSGPVEITRAVFPNKV